jgi:hypothetical protein
VPVGALLRSRDDPPARDADDQAVRETSQQLVRLESLHGGDDVYPLALRAFRIASMNLERLPQAAATDMEAATGEAGEVAAWIAFDADRLDESRRLILESLLLSRSAGDRDMEHLELAHLSMLAPHTGGHERLCESQMEPWRMRGSHVGSAPCSSCGVLGPWRNSAGRRMRVTRWAEPEAQFRTASCRRTPHGHGG